MWLYFTPQHDGFLCNAIWGLKGQAHSAEVSCLALRVRARVRRFLWIPWIFSQYYVWYAILQWEMWFFFICLTLLSWNLAQSDEPWSSFACKDWDAPFIPKHDLLTYYQFTRLLWTVSKRLNLDILYPFHFYFVPVFLEFVAAIKI